MSIAIHVHRPLVDEILYRWAYLLTLVDWLGVSTLYFFGFPYFLIFYFYACFQETDVVQGKCVSFYLRKTQPIKGAHRWMAYCGSESNNKLKKSSRRIYTWLCSQDLILWFHPTLFVLVLIPAYSEILWKYFLPQYLNCAVVYITVH